MDYLLFTYQYGGVLIYILIFVDDILITSSSDSFISSLIAKLHIEFTLKDLGLLTIFLRIQVFWDSHGLHFWQSKYIPNVLHCAKILGAKHYIAPCVACGKLSSILEDLLEDIIDRKLWGLSNIAPSLILELPIPWISYASIFILPPQHIGH